MDELPPNAQLPAAGAGLAMTTTFRGKL